MLRAAFTFTAFVLACALSLPSTANVLTNGGFETGDFTGWMVGGNAERGVAPDLAPITGTTTAGNYVDAFDKFAAFAKLRMGGSPTTLILEQTLTLVPGTQYNTWVTMGIFGDPSISDDNFTLQRSMKVNGNYGLFGIFTANNNGNLYRSGTFGPIYVPAASSGVTTLTFEFGGARTSDGGLAGFTIEDIQVIEVPEPSVLGLGLLIPLMLSRRRRLSHR